MHLHHARLDIVLLAWAPAGLASSSLACIHALPPSLLWYLTIPNCMPTVARNWEQLAATARPSFFPIQIWLFVLAAMIAHDAWFFLAHTAMHQFKWVYRHVHAKHHTLGSNCSPLGEGATFLGWPFLWHLRTCWALTRPGALNLLVRIMLSCLLRPCRHSIHRCR